MPRYTLTDCSSAIHGLLLKNLKYFWPIQCIFLPPLFFDTPTARPLLWRFSVRAQGQIVLQISRMENPYRAHSAQHYVEWNKHIVYTHPKRDVLYDCRIQNNVESFLWQNRGKVHSIRHMAPEVSFADLHHSRIKFPSFNIHHFSFYFLRARLNQIR
jgi:hypothetical protein